VFTDSMETVVFRPFWLRPGQHREQGGMAEGAGDPGYLERNNYETYQESGPYPRSTETGRQELARPGQFLFPNNYNVYLHDTPQGELFKKDVRAFAMDASGSRSRRKLAVWVLGWPEDRVREAEHGPDNKSVRLPSKIPVYIAYFTTYVRDGELYFGNDLYRARRRARAASAGGTTPSEAASREADALRRSMRPTGGK